VFDYGNEIIIIIITGDLLLLLILDIYGSNNGKRDDLDGGI